VPLALGLLALAGCAGTGQSLREALDESAVQARLAARAATLLGKGREPFEVGRERFNPDCSGFVEAVYAAEGIPLRRFLEAAAPRETSAVAAAWEAAAEFGERWQGSDWPAPGDLVFFDDTYDRDGDGRRDDPLTHLGIVEWVAVDGTVTFLHRAGPGVMRGYLNLTRPNEWRDGAGRQLNSPLRVKTSRTDDAPVLAGQLFRGYGRLDRARSPSP
jgi:probable lipoprotein NlpC